MGSINGYHQLGSIDCLVLLISGVPGSGKTTVSYELLKRYNEFRIIQETDLIREVLRGYNDYLDEQFDSLAEQTHDIIPDHRKMFNYHELKEQCSIMRNSIEKIVLRQQRKKIPSIINGVHVVPEVLNGMVRNNDIVFINFFIDQKEILSQRWKNRDPKKYMPNLDVAFETNLQLCKSTLELSKEYPATFYNINVTNLTIDQTVNKIVEFIQVNRH